MADGRVIIETKLDTTGLESGAKSAKSTVNNLGKSMETAGKQSEVLDSGLAKVGASLKSLEAIAKSTVVVKLVSKAVQIIGDIGDATSVVVEKMKAASTLFGDVAVDEENLLNQLYKISSETGESMEVLGQSVYDALSASVEPTEDMANVLKVVSNSAKLAKGGFTDTSTALSATLTVINAYKLGLEDLDSVQSMLLQTQNKGVTTVGELGSALASVTPTAASFGVKFADIATSLALMTKQGTNTKVATTALAQVISELGKSGTTASENLEKAADSAGLSETSFKGLLNAGYSLGEILEIMNKYAEENGKSMVDMFSSVEAGRATLQLVGDNAGDFNDILESMENSSGLVSASFEKTVDQSERLSTAWTNLKSQIGMKLQPAVSTLQGGLANVIEKMTGQELSADDLSTALSDVELTTKAAQSAQEAFKESLDATTQSQYQQSYAASLTALQNLSDAYNEAEKQMNKYSKEAESANMALRDNKYYAELALKEAQRMNSDITFEDLLKQCVEVDEGFRELSSVFPYVADSTREIYQGSIIYLADAEKAVKSSESIAESWSNTMSSYVDSVANMVKNGVVDINLLRAINENLADDVEDAMKRIDTAVDSTAGNGANAAESAQKTIVSLVNETAGVKSSFSEVLKVAQNALENGRIVDDNTLKGLEDYKKGLETLVSEFATLGSSTNSATMALAEVNKVISDCEALKEMSTEYDAIMAKSDMLTDKQDALGNTMQSWDDVLEELNELYKELAEKYGVTSIACTTLASKITELKQAHEDSVTPLEEMESAYQEIIDKSNKLTGEQDALGNTMQSWTDVIEDLNKLYKELAEKYGTTSDACVKLKSRIIELKEAHNEELTPLEEMEKAYNAIIEKSEKLTGKKDALGNTIRTEQDDIEELNDLYIELVEKYGEASDAVQWLKEQIDKLNDSADVDEWKKFGATIKDSLESAGESLAQGLGSAFEDLLYDIFTTKEQIAELDEQLDEVSKKEEENIKAITLAEKELNAASARGNAVDKEAAQQKLEKLKETQAALKKERATIEENKESVKSGADAWKSASKVALEALAEVLESLGAQLAALAVAKAVHGNWAMAAVATAGSVAAYIAAAGIKAAAAKYEQGGIVPGNSRHGDQIVARVNSGELILNAAQQDNLARIIEASAVLAQANGGGGGITVNFEGVNFYGLDEPAVGKAIYENIKTLQYEGVIR